MTCINREAAVGYARGATPPGNLRPAGGGDGGKLPYRRRAGDGYGLQASLFVLGKHFAFQPL